MKKTDTLILIFSALGIIVSAYLSYTYFSSGETTFCLSGSGCDVVKESPFSKNVWYSSALYRIAGLYNSSAYCII